MFDFLAKKNIDYLPPNRTEIAIGSMTATAVIPILQDNVIENIESFRVDIVNVSPPAVIGNANTVIVEIIDYDYGKHMLTELHRTQLSF